MLMSISRLNDRPARRVYIVLSPSSLPYAQYGIQTLVINSLDWLDITLVTDSVADGQELTRFSKALKNPQNHSIQVKVEEELADLEAAVFDRRPNVRVFRKGHPCWRKITDPLLLSEPGDDFIVLDPDLYFPNRFRFERTPPQGLLLMWQRPNCLLPPEVVQSAMRNGISLASHVDIGVAHWRSPIDLEWLDWMLGKLGGPFLPRVMHVEAIVWAAIAMREGGGHLDPRYWRCWARTPIKRLMRKSGWSGKRILSSEPWRNIKCFHAGGEAKWWLGDLEQQGPSVERSEESMVRPFIQLTSERYAREEAYKRIVRSLDYYGVFR
jgi:hypothetical protein